jgi:D-inositol-3-phosphate glycosyltransferase
VKVFVKAPDTLSRAMKRVANALMEFAPTPIPNEPESVYVVNSEAEADLVVLHVVGEEGITEAARLKAAGKKYAIIQYCLRTTQKPNTSDWLTTWRDAEVVWSYYDLRALCEQDGIIDEEGGLTYHLRNFYHAPLGVDTEAFRFWPSVPKKFEILTSGFVAETECVKEASEAAKAVNGKMYHLGPKLINEPHVTSALGIDDDTLAQMYSRSKYVAGLRRGEGFELPAAEGLICGARPICFDAPHYRKWFGEFAIFIGEDSPLAIQTSLERVFRSGYTPVTEAEINKAKALFSWPSIIGGFWQAALKRNVIAPVVEKLPVVVSGMPSGKKRRMLVIADAAVSSGFAKGTHNILETVRETWDVHVLGLNHFGDPHPYPYPIYPCNTIHGGDYFGLSRIAELISKIGPDCVLVQNDPWNFPRYLKTIGNVPTIGAVAVDGLNCQGSALNGLKLAIFWTQFGLDQARLGGYTGPATVIPLGVNREIYYPRSRKDARERLKLPAQRAYVREGFIVGNVNRNQPRKRIDLTVQYFAEWVHRNKIPDAFLYLHVAPTGDAGWDLPQLAKYYGIASRLIYAEPEVGQGITEDELAWTYAIFDALFSTSQGEGMGLTTLESMACGIPNAGSDWAALGDWAREGMILVPCSYTEATPRVNTIGGIMDKESAIQALDALYSNLDIRKGYAERALAVASEPRFEWREIGEAYVDVIDQALATNGWEGVNAGSITVDRTESDITANT